MRYALNLAKRYKGRTGLNPAVGSVIVKNDSIIAYGQHKYFGGPHAEIDAINNSKESVAGADMYISLEPCSHYGKTPPCVDAIIKHKIKNVIIGMVDPNPLVKNNGIQKLNDNGIPTTIENLNGEIDIFYRDFQKYIEKKIPYFRLKTAISIDGKIALNSQYSKWITNEKSRKYVHKLRSQSDAILIGSNTLIADNPKLNIRYNQQNKENYIIILDSKLITDLNREIFKYHNNNKIIIVTANKDKKTIENYRSKNINVITTTLDKNKRLNVKKILKKIPEFGIKDILIEGGGQTYTYFLKNNLVDETYFFVSNKIIGNDGISVFDSLNLKSFKYQLQNISYKTFDGNILIHGYL
jgi:diaminohydroxyphosphoribosylaminopyrimidine deaminase / 5-amino-6-(5-phosphoribosylamino)uracil reductase